MKKYSLLLSLLFLYFSIDAQVFPIDTIQYHGDSDYLINIVFVGDGYTADEQDKYIEDASDMIRYIFSIRPWSQYRNYFNVFAIRVESNESGVSHPNTASDCVNTNTGVPVMTVDNYFGTQFDNYDIHRLIYPTRSSALAMVYAENFPNYDLPIVLANTHYYGGAGGHYICLPAHENSTEILAHEMGHSFALLSDEYWAGDVYAGESANMTAESDPEKVKWKNWVNYSGVGAYPYGSSGNAAYWYRPHQNCKMQYLNTDYCAVCKQTIIERIHDFVDPLISYAPTGSDVKIDGEFLDFYITKIILPSPNTLKTEWQLDTSVVALNTDSLQLSVEDIEPGLHSLILTIEDTSSYLRVDNHDHLHSSFVIWTFEKSVTSTPSFLAHYRVDLNLFPNPSSDYLMVQIESDQAISGTLFIASANGQTLKSVPFHKVEGKSMSEKINVSGFPPGVYYVSLKNKDFLITSQLIIE